MAELVAYKAADPAETDDTKTLWELVQEAAKEKFGDEIKIIESIGTHKKLDDLDFEVKVLRHEKEPRVERRTVVDITEKDYTNYSKSEVDETVLKGKKEDPRPEETRFDFTTTFLNNWEFIRDKIGALVIELARKGETLSIKRHTDRIEKLAATKKDITNHYQQEEKISVQPMRQVRARSISYAIKYNQDYALEISTEAAVKIPVKYITRCQQLCCFICMPFNCPSTTGLVTAAQLLEALPEFKNQDGIASFVQKGTLSFMGNSTGIDKRSFLIGEPVEE